MLPLFDQLVHKYYGSKNERSKKITENIFFSVIVRAGSILLNLLIIPLSIKFVNNVNYGVWITISSVLTWITFFDIGMGNGLRNKLTASFAEGDTILSKQYVSSAYAAFGIFSFVLCILFFSINPFIDWRSFLNIPPGTSDNIHVVFLIALICFCFQFVLQLINSILFASQRSSGVNLITFLVQLVTLLAILMCSYYGNGNLTTLTWINMLSLVFVLMAANVYFFKRDFNNIRPSFDAVNRKSLQEIFRLGISFFIIQVGALVLFQTSNIIIARYAGPAAVTEFNISYKLFSIVIFGFTVILTPYWSAFTDAYAKNDFAWIRKNVKRTRNLWMLVSVSIVPLLLLMSQSLYQLWIGSSVSISFAVSLSVAVYTVVYMGMVVNTYFLNGIGRIGLQKYLYLFVCLVNIPLSIYFVKLYGVPGVVFSSCILMAAMVVTLWVQTDRILKETRPEIQKELF